MPYTPPFVLPNDPESDPQSPGAGGGFEVDSPWYWNNKGNIRPPAYRGPGAGGAWGTWGNQGGASAASPMGAAAMWRRLQQGNPALGTTRTAGMQRMQVPGQLQANSQAGNGWESGGFGGGGQTYGGGGGYNFDPRYWGAFQNGTPDLQDTNRLIAQLIGGYAPGGSFQVGGDPAVRAFMERQAQQTGRAMQGQAVNAAALQGADPAMAQWMRTQALMGSSGAAAGAMNQYAGQSNLANDQMRRSMLDALMSSNLGLQRQNNQNQWQSGMQQDQLNRQGGFGGFLGGALGMAGGAALGGWLGPGGWFAGAPGKGIR